MYVSSCTGTLAVQPTSSMYVPHGRCRMAARASGAADGRHVAIDRSERCSLVVYILLLSDDSLLASDLNIL
jgi:hypothetical protein